MSGTPNPPIPGHHLIAEGSITPVWSDSGRWGAVDHHNGGCQCGARPDGFPNVSRNRMKEWHRQHKAEIRAAAHADSNITISDVVAQLTGERVDRVALMHQVLDTAEEALREGDIDRVVKVIFVWSQRREYLLAGEERWEDEQV